ncbi:hypothetical protein J2D73_08330 [Acetobacter sacchari]|uniref:Uncharacterized protein n=1 Tax=Acetobacter sacchari TaxID=2661687 RepID=A0ABS3LV68_9PROT|nr:hypothetical protein [Acetobacter sacchari]MBO1359799.1 hypothetical protein [Acetobacter sacchari]
MQSDQALSDWTGSIRVAKNPVAAAWHTAPRGIAVAENVLRLLFWTQ